MDGYTNEELKGLRGEHPSRGEICPVCRSHIPTFLDLSPAEAAEIREIIDGGKKLVAIQRLCKATECSLPWAKIWADHPHGPYPTDPTRPNPCFYCHAPLPTPLARQCRTCGMDWHDESCVVRRGHGFGSSPDPAVDLPFIPPPCTIDGGAVLAWATVDRGVRPTGRTRHVVDGIEMGPAAGLLLMRYLHAHANGVYLLGCDAGWRSITDTYHDTFDEALNQAENEYEGLLRRWRWLPPPPSS